MKQAKFEQEQLIREYVRESLLTEKIDYANQASKLRSGIKKAVKGVAQDAKAVKGKAKELGAALKRGTKLIFGSLAQFLTAGIYEMNREKIDSEYLSTLKNIHKKYGADYENLDSKFKENVDPLVKMGVLYAGPAAALGAAAGLKIASKAQQTGEKLGGSPEIKKMFDDYYDKLAEDMQSIKNDLESKKDNNDAKSKKDKKNAIQKLTALKKHLEDSNEKLKSTGTGEGTLYDKNVEQIKIIDGILKGTGEEQS